eukprot:gnl/TRDRNA2_/TRDRNA2_85248_c0_seq1.p1 gnl/TRDRNA2_/TRDRNA2_85248_c0~~gnl/TRDRNA2_/TRDRNA2_85248_c0_seq1.p1  ORF type:complete len:238 (-),score=42.70 gnl/TRDRNA2_/TRDRNA2_85248_c0_seq1:88-801(-)
MEVELSPRTNASLPVSPVPGTRTSSGDGDPLAVLRQRQSDVYEALLVELRLPPNSAILRALAKKKNSEDGEEGSDVNSNAEHEVQNLATGRTSFSPHEYDFSRVYLGDRQFRPLAAALAIDRHLLALFVPNTGLHDQGMLALCDQLKRSPHLECIDISQNRFSIDGASACVTLARGAQRLLLVQARDTCLDPDFCATRGLKADYAVVRRKLTEIIEPRVMQDPTQSLHDEGSQVKAP